MEHPGSLKGLIEPIVFDLRIGIEAGWMIKVETAMQIAPKIA